MQVSTTARRTKRAAIEHALNVATAQIWTYQGLRFGNDLLGTSPLSSDVPTI